MQIAAALAERARVKNVLGLAKRSLFLSIPGEAKKRHEGGEGKKKKKTEGCDSRSGGGGERISSEGRRKKKKKKKNKVTSNFKVFFSPRVAPEGSAPQLQRSKT